MEKYIEGQQVEIATLTTGTAIRPRMAMAARPRWRAMAIKPRMATTIRPRRAMVIRAIRDIAMLPLQLQPLLLPLL